MQISNYTVMIGNHPAQVEVSEPSRGRFFVSLSNEGKSIIYKDNEDVRFTAEAETDGFNIKDLFNISRSTAVDIWLQVLEAKANQTVK